MKRVSTVTAIMMALLLGLVSCQNDDDDDSVSTGKAPASESFSNALASLNAVEGVSGVYTIEYDGEYYLDQTVTADLKTAAQLLAYLDDAVPTWKTARESGAPLTINVEGSACSSIVAENATTNSGYIYGRNFDWDEGPVLILHTMPDNGYESVSTCYMAFVSNDTSWAPTSSVENDALALGAIYVPMDGMNEKGLYIANLQNDTEPTIQDAAEKHFVQTTVAMRYILDRAATVDEAVAFLESINMCAVYAGENNIDDHHFALADNTGKSIVVEWINGELKTVNTKVVTNHSLVNEHADTNHGTFRRYDSLVAAGEAVNWKMTSQQVADALKGVQQDDSVWSAVFEPSAKRVTYYFRAETITNEDEPIDYTKPVVVQF